MDFEVFLDLFTTQPAFRLGNGRGNLGEAWDSLWLPQPHWGALMLSQASPKSGTAACHQESTQSAGDWVDGGGGGGRGASTTAGLCAGDPLSGRLWRGWPQTVGYRTYPRRARARSGAISPCDSAGVRPWLQEHAKIPHRGALTHYVLAEPNRSRAHASTILTGATDNELCFPRIYFQTMGMEPGAERW